jgi:hypothetical protein
MWQAGVCAVVPIGMQSLLCVRDVSMQAFELQHDYWHATCMCNGTKVVYADNLYYTQQMYTDIPHKIA